MFRTLKIPIGLVIALTMSVLALTVVIVNKLEHNASVVDVVKGNTATLSNALSLQLSVAMERSSGDNALFSSLFQPIKEHDNLISATLYDNDYQVISTIQPDSLSQLSNQSVPLDPAEIPFGVTQYDNVITAHQIVGVAYTHLDMLFFMWTLKTPWRQVQPASSLSKCLSLSRFGCFALALVSLFYTV